jgi:phosphoglycolate phosphatase-like HAD superfamily hydrolase
VRALVLDFDGVLFDSARESFAVARRTYLELRPDSAIARVDEGALYRDFLALMPLGNGAPDYGAALALLERGPAPATQREYDDLRSAQDGAWLEFFRVRFYEHRHAWATRSPEEWCRLMPPFPGIVDLLRRRRGEVAYAIATAKDRPSVDRLLAAHGLADLFPPELIRDREAGPDKTAHLGALRCALGLPAADVTFVDDKVSHLDSAAALGMRCALAAWGYNGPREHRAALARGYLVCGIADAERTLFAA